MHAEPLTSGTKVCSGAERVRSDEDTVLRPPQRDLLPPARGAHVQEIERADGPARNDVVRNTQPGCNLRAVTVVTVEELDHARGIAKLIDPRPVHGIDEPHAPFDDERV